MVRSLLSPYGTDESGVGTMSVDVLWWLGVFLSLGVVAGVAWIFEP